MPQDLFESQTLFLISWCWKQYQRLCKCHQPVHGLPRILYISTKHLELWNGLSAVNLTDKLIRCLLIPFRLVILFSSVKSLPNTLIGGLWYFLFLGNLTLRKKFVNRFPCLTKIEVGSLLWTVGGFGRALLLLSALLLLFNSTIWACLGGSAGSFLTGRRPIETRSIRMGWSTLTIDFCTSLGESLLVLLLWIPLSSVELSPLEEDPHLIKSRTINVNIYKPVYLMTNPQLRQNSLA